ncbi:HAD-IIIC family phosphatase [Blastochloris tepida]|uniref:HAD-IIIC family phosphatase n=1 Tax=Blastochloris tepida TaxID=2233851 RepID=A0A348FZ87_9HYPH|nr:HAD-IIIC family phosphatase [Blastochloris tepida]BBF92620.1 hypothetical protein BLTE_13050 [Blastochloris tepida]
MYQVDWSQHARWRHDEAPATLPATRLDPADVAGVMLLHWQEHCVECAVPLCYSSCRLYVARADNRCARFAHGIVRVPAAGGPLGFGADIRFRRWGKLEAEITGRRVSLPAQAGLDRIDGAAARLAAAARPLGRLVDPSRSIANDVLDRLRAQAFRRLGQPCRDYDAFVIECFNPGETVVRLSVTMFAGAAAVMRHGIDLSPGANFAAIPITLPADPGGDGPYRLTVHPDGDAEARLIFTWLDFVALRAGARLPEAAPSKSVPAAKVKCVAWDLDNTVWRGVLVEDGAAGLTIRPEAVALVHRLDERGIIQTIVSKNNHDEAMAVLRDAGLADHFLHPAINWGQKSANLRQIATRLNIGLDTFALIDDQPFERQEVASALPMVRTYPEVPLDALLERPEFDVPVTSASRQRRLSYLTEVERERALEVFSGDYAGFLRSCGITVRIFTPSTPQEIARCLELIDRTNQLNLSGRRYEPQAFAELLADPAVLCFAIDCADRFGSYGLVGFASIAGWDGTPTLRDFVMSCRVAQKRVEHCVLGWAARRARARGHAKLNADLRVTARNTPLTKVFEDMRFATETAEADRRLLSLDLAQADLDDDGIIGLDSRALDEVAACGA